MKDFSFLIEDFGTGCMTWCIQFDDKKFNLRPTYLFGDDIQHLLWAVLGFHPDYDESKWGMASERQEEHIPCDQIRINEEGSIAVWDISVIEGVENSLGRILHMHIIHDLNVSQNEYDINIPYFDFAEEIMNAIDSLIRKIGLTRYYIEWGTPFPLTEFLNAKALLMRKQPERWGSEINILNSPFYIAYMDEPMRKFTLVSNTICYGQPPEMGDIIEQRITITNKGRVNITSTAFAGFVAEKKCFYIDKYDAKDIIQDLVDYFQQRELMVFATDGGSWDLFFESEKGEKYQFSGSLGAEDGAFLEKFSSSLRRYLKRRDLFVFDAQNQSGLIFLSCEFEGGGKSYYYLTDDETIEIGDYVRVPVGEHGRTAIVEVVDVEYFEENNTPMSLDKVKTIIEKVDEFGEYPEDEEDA